MLSYISLNLQIWFLPERKSLDQASTVARNFKVLFKRKKIFQFIHYIIWIPYNMHEDINNKKIVTVTVNDVNTDPFRMSANF